MDDVRTRAIKNGFNGETDEIRTWKCEKCGKEHFVVFPLLKMPNPKEELFRPTKDITEENTISMAGYVGALFNIGFPLLEESKKMLEAYDKGGAITLPDYLYCSTPPTQ